MCFHFHFWLHDKQQEQLAAQNGMVEDNPHIMEINRGTLFDAGYRVLEAKSLAEARIVLETEAPGLLVLDIMLPDGDGTVFCAELREQGITVPVLFLTAGGASWAGIRRCASKG